MYCMHVSHHTHVEKFKGHHVLVMEGKERRLLVRGFPHWLLASEKKSLLSHFGATEVFVLPTRGKMRNCVFATFSSHEDAKRALEKLHQLQVVQSRLVVEYVQKKHSHLSTYHWNDDNDNDDEERTDECQQPESRKESAAPPLPPPPAIPHSRLSYSYPPPSPSTLTNITHTLAAVPNFYEQVLHLMNLMNLPPPFGPAPPSQQAEGGRGQEEKRESDIESEISSDGEEKRSLIENTRTPLSVRDVKRRPLHVTTSERAPPPPPKRRKSSSSHHQFDSSPLTATSRKISMNVPSVILPRPPDNSNIVSVATITSVPSGNQEKEEEEEEGEMEEEEKEELEMKFLTSEELAQNRISREEMEELSVFRGYTAGEPSLRLYIKNLSRQTTEQDIRRVYGGYIDWNDERERAAFDIRLMTTGRMKGQAFVGLPSEEAATRAVLETNGYLLAGRPMIVHFARTAKAKPNQ